MPAFESRQSPLLNTDDCSGGVAVPRLAGGGSAGPVRVRVPSRRSKACSRGWPPPLCQIFVSCGLVARPNQLWRVVTRPTTRGSPSRFTSSKSWSLKPLVATSACRPSFRAMMFNGRSLITACRPTGLSVQPFGSRNPFSPGPGKTDLGSPANPGAMVEIASKMVRQRMMALSRRGKSKHAYRGHDRSKLQIQF